MISENNEVYDFRNKKVLITGGTKGLGMATAKIFAKFGADLFLTYRSDNEAAIKAKKEITNLGVGCTTIAKDLSVEGEIDALFSEIREEIEQLDVYIHNAAATAFKNLSQIKGHHIDKTLNITIKSFILGTQHAAKLMKDEGAIVTVSGMDTLRAVPAHGLLAAAKAGLETLTGYYAHELATQNIRVNCVNPGFLRTQSTEKYLGSHFEKINDMFAQNGPYKREPQLEEIANVIVFLCSKQASWIIGETIKVDGGWNFAMPLGGIKLPF